MRLLFLECNTNKNCDRYTSFHFQTTAQEIPLTYFRKIITKTRNAKTHKHTLHPNRSIKSICTGVYSCVRIGMFFNSIIRKSILNTFSLSLESHISASHKTKKYIVFPYNTENVKSFILQNIIIRRRKEFYKCFKQAIKNANGTTTST